MYLKIFHQLQTDCKYICKLGRQFANGWNQDGRQYKINCNSPYTRLYRELLKTLALEYNIANGEASVHKSLSSCLKGMTNRTSGVFDNKITVFKLNSNCTEILEIIEINSDTIETYLKSRGLPYYD